MSFTYLYSSSISGTTNPGYVNVDQPGLTVYINQFTASGENVDYTLNPVLTAKSKIFLNGSGGNVYACVTGGGSVTVNVNGQVEIPCTSILLDPGQGFGNGQSLTVVIVEAPLIDEISNIDIIPPLANGDVITFDSLSNTWINLPGAGGSIAPTYPLSLPAYAAGESLDYSVPLSKLVNVPQPFSDMVYMYDSSGTATPAVGKFSVADNVPAPGVNTLYVNVTSLTGRDMSGLWSGFPFKDYLNLLCNPFGLVSASSATDLSGLPVASFTLGQFSLTNASFANDTVVTFQMNPAFVNQYDPINKNFATSSSVNTIGVVYSGTAANNTVVASQVDVSGTSNTIVNAHGPLAFISQTVQGSRNTAIGTGALFSAPVPSTANDCIAIGVNALSIADNATECVVIGNFNMDVAASNVTRVTSVGTYALGACTTGENDAFGSEALGLCTTSSGNVAVGRLALSGVVGGSGNNVGVGRGGVLGSAVDASDCVAIGNASMSGAVTAGQVLQNVAIGSATLVNCPTTQGTVAIGYKAMELATVANSATAVGYQALQLNQAAGGNAFGFQALSSNTTGTGNVAFGSQALFNSTIGLNNIAIGNSALSTSVSSSDNTVVGNLCGSALTGSSNVVLGSGAGTSVTSSNNVVIGANAAPALSLGVGSNVVIGSGAGTVLTDIGNVLIGQAAANTLVTGDVNTLIGSSINTDTNAVRCSILGGRSQISPGVSNSVGLGYTTTLGHNNAIALGSGCVTGGANTLNLNGITGSGSATAGAGGVLPAQVNIYLPIWINNVEYRIALYNP